MHSTTADYPPTTNHTLKGQPERTAKGSGVISMINYAKQHGDEQRFERFLQRFSPEDRETLGGIVTPVMRFKETTNQALINNLVAEFLDGDPERAVELGRFIIDDGLSTIYRVFFKVGSPKMIIARANRLWRQYHEVGSLETFDIESKSIRVRLTFPYTDLAFCRLMTGTVFSSLERSGANNVILKHEKCAAKGDPYCQYYVTWD